MAYKLVDDVFWIDDIAYIPASIHIVSLDQFHSAGVHLELANNIILSIAWGSCTYSDNHDHGLFGLFGGMPFNPEPERAELAAWHGDKEWITWPNGDQIFGYASTKQANLIIEYLLHKNYNADELGWMLSILATSP